MDHPCFNIFGHPTGKMRGKRDSIDIDLEKIMKKAKDKGCIMELNSQPDRLDLNDANCRMAKEYGLKIAVSTDAHQGESLNFIRFGIGQARRGWLEKKDVINTKTWKSLKKVFKRK